jgi:cytoskeleton protein RodZ
MKITGQILRDAREKKGISIAEVSLATKINTRVITAMEDGNLTKLPPKTFLRGFVLSYATFLQLDLDSLMAKFQEEFGAAKPEIKPIEDTLSTAPSPRSLDPITPNSIAKIGAVIGILILIGLIVLLRNKMESYRNETITAAAAPAATPTPVAGESPSASATPTASGSPSQTPISSATPSPTATPTATPSATPAPTATPKPAPTQAPTPAASVAPHATAAYESDSNKTTSGDFLATLFGVGTASPPKSAADVAPKPSSTPKAAPSPSVSPTATPKPKATPKATPAPGETPVPTPKPASKGGKPQDVTLEALDNVTIDATIDDEAPKKLTLKPDQVQTIKAKRKVSLQLSDGGAVNIIVNGTDRGVPGDLGQPKKVDIP